ncbi:MAG: hypothetical protein ACRDTF_25050 [Pseudonocardiaceae bacterium]
MNESSPAYPDHGVPTSIGSPRSADQPPHRASSEEDADLAPLGTEEEFAAELADLVASQRPRLFSLCAEYGDRADGWVVAWGLAFEDRAELIGTDGETRATCQSAESALRMLSRRRRLRLLWCDPKSAERGGPPDEPATQQAAG